MSDSGSCDKHLKESVFTVNVSLYIIVDMQRLVLDETSKESDSSGNTILITAGLQLENTVL